SFPVSLPIPDLEPPLEGYCHLLMRGETQTDPPVPHYSTKPDSISNRKIPVSVKLLAKCDTFAPTQAFLLIRLAKLAFLLYLTAFSRSARASNSTWAADQSGRNPSFAFMRGSSTSRRRFPQDRRPRAFRRGGHPQPCLTAPPPTSPLPHLLIPRPRLH